MGFLQLNKNHHIDKPIIIKLLEDPTAINGLAKEFNGKTFLEFSIEVENIGQEYFTKGEDSYKINAGQKVEFKMSDSLHKKIVNFQERELVYINMKPRSKGGFLYDIKPALGEDIEKLNKNRLKREQTRIKLLLYLIINRFHQNIQTLASMHSKTLSHIIFLYFYLHKTINLGLS